VQGYKHPRPGRSIRLLVHMGRDPFVIEWEKQVRETLDAKASNASPVS